MFRNLGGRFSEAPQANIKRSIFGFKHTHKTTFNAGELVPIFVQEVLPGDTFDINVSSLIRLSTPLHPTMDNLFLDTYFFFVPNRLVWDNWQKFMGENDQAWAQDTDNFTPPYLEFDTGDAIEAGSLLNYLGVPVLSATKKKIKLSVLDMNCYFKIFNDWFRDENLQDEVPFYKGDAIVPSSYANSYSQYLTNNFGIVGKFYRHAGNLLHVARFHDYFSSALPAPQKGPDVLIPSGGVVEFDNSNFDSLDTDTYPKIRDKNGNVIASASGLDTSPIGVLGAPSSDTNSYPAWYDPSGSLVLDGLQITVNNLRLAIQTQKLLEADARGGTRYIELIYSHFGVKSPDARLQRSEYLGGKRTLLNMDEVINQAQTSTSPLGVLGGRSVSSTNENGFVKSFTEHGYIIGLATVRHSRTYSQGLPRRYSRFNRLSYYWPVLANIGEQPILNKEIYVPNSTESVSPDDVFGYQEAWAEYRYTPDRLSGLFSPDATGTLVSWTYGDAYSSTPSLSSLWLHEGSGEVARSVVVNSEPQFLADFYFHGKAVRPMPVFSVPGLMDHH